MSSTWISVNETTQLRFLPLWDMQWKNVSQTITRFVPSKFGGPLAIISEVPPSQDDRKKLFMLQIFSASGRNLQAESVPTFDSAIVLADWNASHKLVLVFEDGNCRCFSCDGHKEFVICLLGQIQTLRICAALNLISDELITVDSLTRVWRHKIIRMSNLSNITQPEKYTHNKTCLTELPPIETVSQILPLGPKDDNLLFLCKTGSIYFKAEGKGNHSLLKINGIPRITWLWRKEMSSLIVVVSSGMGYIFDENDLITALQSTSRSAITMRQSTDPNSPESLMDVIYLADTIIKWKLKLPAHTQDIFVLNNSVVALLARNVADKDDRITQISRCSMYIGELSSEGEYASELKLGESGFVWQESEGVIYVYGMKTLYALHIVHASTEAVFGVGSCCPAALLYFAGESDSDESSTVAVSPKSLDENNDDNVLQDCGLRAILFDTTVFGNAHCALDSHILIGTLNDRSITWERDLKSFDMTSIDKLIIRRSVDWKQVKFGFLQHGMTQLQLEETFSVFCEAALQEWDPSGIHRLLSYARAILVEKYREGLCENLCWSKFLISCRDARILTTLRSWPFEISMSINQYRSLGIHNIANLLTNLGHHSRAVNLLLYFNFDISEIHDARSQIHDSQSQIHDARGQVQDARGQTHDAPVSFDSLFNPHMSSIVNVKSIISHWLDFCIHKISSEKINPLQKLFFDLQPILQNRAQTIPLYVLKSMAWAAAKRSRFSLAESLLEYAGGRFDIAGRERTIFSNMISRRESGLRAALESIDLNNLMFTCINSIYSHTDKHLAEACARFQLGYDKTAPSFKQEIDMYEERRESLMSEFLKRISRGRKFEPFWKLNGASLQYGLNSLFRGPNINANCKVNWPDREYVLYYWWLLIRSLERDGSRNGSWTLSSSGNSKNESNDGLSILSNLVSLNLFKKSSHTNASSVGSSFQTNDKESDSWTANLQRFSQDLCLAAARQSAHNKQLPVRKVVEPPTLTLLPLRNDVFRELRLIDLQRRAELMAQSTSHVRQFRKLGVNGVNLVGRSLTDTIKWIIWLNRDDLMEDLKRFCSIKEMMLTKIQLLAQLEEWEDFFTCASRCLLSSVSSVGDFGLNLMRDSSTNLSTKRDPLEGAKDILLSSLKYYKNPTIESVSGTSLISKFGISNNSNNSNNWLFGNLTLSGPKGFHSKLQNALTTHIPLLISDLQNQSQPQSYCTLTLPHTLAEHLHLSDFVSIAHQQGRSDIAAVLIPFMVPHELRMLWGKFVLKEPDDTKVATHCLAVIKTLRLV